MRLKLYILIAITLIFQQVKAQEFHYYTYEVIRDTVKETVTEYDTIIVQPKLDSILKHFNLSFNDFINTFQNYVTKNRKKAIFNSLQIKIFI